MWINIGMVVAVSMLWGCTNPLLRKGGVSHTSIIPFVLNQIGSAVYAMLLGRLDLSLALPLCNALAFVLTAATGYFLGEKIASPMFLCIGSLFVLAGAALCTVSSSLVV